MFNLTMANDTMAHLFSVKCSETTIPAACVPALAPASSNYKCSKLYMSGETWKKIKRRLDCLVCDALKRTCGQLKENLAKDMDSMASAASSP